jgi:hypothetical protein
MPDYIIEPLDTDAEQIFQSFVEYVQGYFPTWQPSEGQLDVIIARYFAMQTAFTADMASRVQRAIYRYFGANLAGIPPLAGTPASGTVQFAIDDPLTPPIARTLAYGSLIGLTDPDGDIQVFMTTADMPVAAGAATAQVAVQAVDPGTVGNGISGDVQMIDFTDWLGDGFVVGATSGGTEPEQDDVYIQRLTDNLRLMAPRPILAEDFGFMAQNVAGVWRAAVIDNYRAGTNEVQTLSSNYTGGNFTLTFNGKVTANLPYNATAAQVLSALAALTNFDTTDADVTGGPLPTTPIAIAFKGKWGQQDVAAITAQNVSLTGGSSIAIATTTPGVAYNTDLANSIGISAVDVDGNPLSATVKSNLLSYLQAYRAQNFLINWVDPAYHPVDVTYTARALKNQDQAAVKTAIETGLATYLSAANWGTYPQQPASRAWMLSPNVRYLELTTIVENAFGVDFCESLTFALDGSALSTADKTFTGPFSLTMPGTFIGTINMPT